MKERENKGGKSGGRGENDSGGGREEVREEGRDMVGEAEREGVHLGGMRRRKSGEKVARKG